ncbi:Hypothetical predicted protein, partial [Argonauta hians]
LYDAVYHCYFGYQWNSPCISSSTGKGKSANLQFNEPVYMHTTLKAAGVIIVVELVALTKQSDGVNKAKSLGWGIIRPFAVDTEHSNTVKNAPKKVQLYQGTPRALLLIDEPIERCEHLTAISGRYLTCYVNIHKALFKIIHLIPENVFFGQSDKIPGLQQSAKTVNLFQKPKLSAVLMCQLNHILVTIPPNIERFEEELCQSLSEDYLNNISNADSNLTNVSINNELVSITERRLKLAVHNGWCYTGKEEIIHLDVEYSNINSNVRSPSPAPRPRNSHRRRYSLTSNSSSNAVGLVLRSPCYIKDLFESPHCSVVLSLEYVISEPMMEEHMKFARSTPWAFKRVVLLRWGVWKPFDSSASGQEMVENVHIIPFTAGPSRNPDEVFVYRGTPTDMYDEHVARMAQGNIQFSATLHQQEQNEGFNNIGKVAAKTKPIGMPPLSVKSPREIPLKKAVNTTGVNQSLQSQQTNMSPLNYPSSTAAAGVSHISVPYDAGTSMSPAPVYPHQQQQLQSTPGVTALSSPYQQPVVAAPPACHYGAFDTQSAGGNQVSELTKQLGSMRVDAVAEPVELLKQTPTSRHNPILAQAPHTTSCKSLSRGTYNLLSAHFSPIRDRHGDPTEIIDPERTDMDSDFTFDHRDPLSCNEIIFQFLALNRIFDSQTAAQQDIQSVFFTFQFYKYPPITTERLQLCQMKDREPGNSSTLNILHKINKEDRKSKASAGFEIRYFVDPCFLKLGEFPLFLQYLQNHILHIDVWNGNSLLLLGSSSVPLKYLCRRGDEAVQCTVELDILMMETPGEIQDMGEDIGKLRDIQPYGSTPVSKGKLHLRMANIGHPPKNVEGSKKGVKNKKKISLASHLLQSHPELGTVITSQKTFPAPLSAGSLREDSSAERKRKLARMEMVKKQLPTDMKTDIVLIPKDDMNQRVRDLRMLELYRLQTKRECIMNMLNANITKEHVIFPTFAVAEFFEFVLLNPSNVQETITIEYDDPELSIITNAEEWRSFKSENNLQTPVEEDMFADENHTDTKWKQVLMRPKESINIPFKFQSFTADHSISSQGPNNFLGDAKCFTNERGDSCKNIPSRTIRIQFRMSSGGILSILYLKLMFQPHVVDQTFRFYQPEQSFLKKSIHLPPSSMLPGVPVGVTGEPQQVFVRCSDPNIICNCKDRLPGEPLDVFIKVSIGVSPQVKKFFVAIYGHRFQSQPIQIWEVIIHALQRVDVVCVEGQSAKFSLILRGTHSSRFARCFASHPQQMKLDPSEAFTLSSGSVRELNVTVRPKSAGCKFFYINMVDIDYCQLLRSWLVCVKTETPAISRLFELKLPVGGGPGSNKKISYHNPYGINKLFSLHTNRDDLLQFKENQLNILAGQTYDIGLRFAPVLREGSVDILVFIEDEQGQNEETFCVKANYTT